MENLISTKLLSVILAECSEQMMFRMVTGCYMDRVKLAMCLLAPDFTPHLDIQCVNSNYTANSKFRIGTVIDLEPSEISDLKFPCTRHDLELKILEELKDFLKYYKLSFRESTKKEIERYEEDDLN